MGTSVLMIERHYSDLEPVKAIDQLRGEETRRLIDAGTVVDEAYQSKKLREKRWQYRSAQCRTTFTASVDTSAKLSESC